MDRETVCADDYGCSCEHTHMTALRHDAESFTCTERTCSDATRYSIMKVPAHARSVAGHSLLQSGEFAGSVVGLC